MKRREAAQGGERCSVLRSRPSRTGVLILAGYGTSHQSIVSFKVLETSEPGFGPLHRVPLVGMLLP